MFETHFGFKANPFTIAPNPSYLYVSEQHREALAHLQYGLLEHGGFIVLTGEVGTGKTTIWRCFCEDIPEDIHLAVLLSPCATAQELLQAICDEFGLAYEEDASIRKLTETINHYLLECHQAGKRCVLIVEEAQGLSDPLLEQLRLLTNLETNEHKLLQIILIGQPELADKIEQPHLRQLKQRITARYHLSPLSKKEVHAYVEHRLLVAGGEGSIFTRDALALLAKKSRGIPRLINLICERALLGCYAQAKRQVSLRILNQAATEVLGNKLPARSIRERITPMLTARLGKGAWPAVASLAVVLSVIVFSAQIQSTASTLNQQLQASIALWTDSNDTTSEASEVSAPQAPSSLAQAEPGSEPGSELGKTPAQIQAMHTKAPVAQPTDWLAHLASHSRQQDPYQTLFQLWGIEMADKPAQPPCQHALDYALDCWHRRGEINSIKRVNRPAVLKMVSAEGQPFYATLVQIEGGQLKLSAGNTAVSVDESALQGVWTGEYTLFWKRPTGYRDTLHPGDKNNLVPWVSHQLAVATGKRYLLSDSKVYSPELQINVREFQSRCGLFADGLVGKETLITLNSVALGQMPVLHRTKASCLKG